MNPGQGGRIHPVGGLPGRVYRFYRDGFCQMTVGRTLWKIIFIKLFIMFAILKTFFFPDFLATNFTDDRQRAEHVIDQLTRQQTISTSIPGKGE